MVELINLKAYSPTYRKIIDAVSTDMFVIRIIAALIVAPIIEELVFRGILFFKLRIAIPRVLAILISATVFGIAHFNLVQGVYATLLGIVFAIIYDRTGKLIYPIFAHMAANTFALFAPGLQIFKVIESNPVYNNVFGIVALLLGFLLLFYWKKS